MLTIQTTDTAKTLVEAMKNGRFMDWAFSKEIEFSGITVEVDHDTFSGEYKLKLVKMNRQRIRPDADFIRSNESLVAATMMYLEIPIMKVGREMVVLNESTQEPRSEDVIHSGHRERDFRFVFSFGKKTPWQNLADELTQ